jgi:hypothetical protein
LKDLRKASISLEVYDPTGALAGMKEDLDKLLKDYGCSVDWTGLPE